MATLPSLTPFTAGERITAIKLNANTVGAINTTVMNKPICYIYQITTAQNVPTSANTVATFNATKFDTDSMADLVNYRININTPGIYRLTAQVSFAAQATAAGFRAGHFAKSGVSDPLATTLITPLNNQPPRFGLTTIERFTAGQNVQLVLSHTAGVSLSTFLLGGGVFLSAEWIGA